MKNILLLTDFSENATNAISYAINVFREDVCNFYILNTYTPVIPHSRFMAATVKSNLLKDSAKYTSEKGITDTITAIKKADKNPLHNYYSISSFSLLINEITEIIEQKNINFLVSGTKGASEFKQTFIGTNTVRMIKTIGSCPILAIPNKYSFVIPKHIALATDLKKSVSLEALDILLSFTKRYNCKIHIIHIKTNSLLDKFQQSNLKILQSYFANVNQTLHLLPFFSNKPEVISCFLKDYTIDTLVLVYSNHSYLEELMHQTVIETASYHTKIPLLVLPN